MNAILVILDSLRKDHVRVYGNDRIRTPNLDALAGGSLRFTRAYPESIPTIPARRAIHTGLRTWPFRDWEPPEGEDFMPAGWQHIPEDQTTLAEFLNLRQGFNTVLLSDTHHLFKASMNFQRGFKVFDWVRGQERDRYRPTTRVSQEAVDRLTVPGNSRSMEDKVRQYIANTRDRDSEEDYFAPRVFTMATEFLRTADRGQPFFLVVDCFDPHEPWDPPERYVSMYDDGYSGPEPIVPEYDDAGWIDERELERMRALYAAEVTMTDRWLGRFLETLDSSSFASETALVVLSDHGVALGEHDATGKPFWALYPELTDIPFFVRHPEGNRGGETSDFFASTHDVAPTILGLLGLEPEQPMEGQDLSVLFDGRQPQERNHFTLGYDEYVWTRDDRFVMLSRNDGADARLYDLSADPRMNVDVAGDNPEVVERMFDEYVIGDAGGPPPRY
ncbi:MAG TPA: sulfatase [Rubrobacteraceae bacterium]|jgi:arylsulfatase A-like enzyme|nr:sulfatase [Rubrobacteraceae bacterium]